MGLTAVKEGIDIEILHQQMLAEAKKAKKVKRWWDDDGDGKGYEKHEVKKESVTDSDLINKLRASGVFTEEELKKIAETDHE